MLLSLSPKQAAAVFRALEESLRPVQIGQRLTPTQRDEAARVMRRLKRRFDENMINPDDPALARPDKQG